LLYSQPCDHGGVANLHFLRGYNDAVVLRLARGGEPMTRVELAARSGLTPQAVSKIVTRLIADGLLVESGRRNVGVGKPRTLLELVPTSRFALGAHVERDELRVVLADLAGSVVDRTVVPLPPGFGPEELVASLASQVEVVLGRNEVPDERLLGLGIGFLGPLDHRRGVVHDATGLSEWHDVPLRDLVARRLGLNVLVDKDSTVAVVAESWRRGEEFRDAALVLVGTGLGAGLLLDGTVHRGARTNAGEFGHTTVQLDGPRCACGRTGCVEVVHNIAAASGDHDRAVTVLGTAVADLVQLLDVDHVVLGGRSVLRAPERYASGVRDTVRAQIPRSDWLAVEVGVSELGEDLVAAGAAMLVLDEFYGLRAPSTAGPAA
jgi:predicted NBD/HSP70 family sugar kinase